MGNYQVVVHSVVGEKETINLCRTYRELQRMTVLQLKEKIVEKLPQYAAWKDLRLIFSNKLLDGDYTLLSEYGIQHKSEIRIVGTCFAGIEMTPSW